MKILVTGADGLLGSNLVRELLNRGHQVSVMLLQKGKSPTLEGLQIDRLYGNVLNANEVDQCIEGHDVVFHCAAFTSLFPARNKKAWEINYQGTKHMAESCLKHGVKRLIFVGTANSFGKDGSKLAREDQHYEASVYGLDYMDSKRKAQELILDYVKTRNLPALIVNPTFMLGPFDVKPSSGSMILAIRKGKVPAYTSGGKNYICVKDAVEAMANAITMGRIGECYILGNENLSYKEAFQRIAKVVDGKAPSKKLPDAFIRGYGWVNSLLGQVFRFSPDVTKELANISCDEHYYDVEKARKELKLKSTPIEEGIQDAFHWFCNHGYVNCSQKKNVDVPTKELST